MTNHPPSVLWHCWLANETCPCSDLYCVEWDVRPYSASQPSIYLYQQSFAFVCTERPAWSCSNRRVSWQCVHVVMCSCACQ